MDIALSTNEELRISLVGIEDAFKEEQNTLDGLFKEFSEQVNGIQERMSALHEEYQQVVAELARREGRNGNLAK